MSDILQVQGINSKGFGMIPKLVMQDRRLTVQAKAIYSYFASYAGGGQTAFPSRAKILADLEISVKTYYRHLNRLKERGYVKADQEKNQRGQFKRNVSTLTTDIPVSPDTHNDHTEPCSKNCPTAPCSNLPCTQIYHTNNKNTVLRRLGFLTYM